MDLLKSNFPWLIGAGAILSTSWRYVLLTLSWVRSVFIIKVSIRDSSTAFRFQEYMQKVAKPVKSANINYGTMHKYIYSKKRALFIAFKKYGSGTLFLKGWVPILLTGAESDKERSSGQAFMTVTYIRGTFNFEEEFVKATNEFNEELLNSKEETRRFRIRRHFGKGNRRYDRNDKLSGKAEEASEAPSHEEERSLIPLNFKREDYQSQKKETYFSGLAYSDEIKKKVEVIKHWKNSRDWFNDREIPWTRAIRFRGKPGTGKTSMAKALAQELNMPIHIIDLSQMNNEELVEAWADVVSDAPSIALFEDLDRLFDEDKKFILKDLTLDCLLNCMSGVSDSSGVLTISTVNFPDRLDIALGVIDENGKSTRPGRLDFEIVFDELDEKCRYEIAMRILDDYPTWIPEVVKMGNGDTGAQFTNRCCELATELYWKNFEKDQRLKEELKLCPRYFEQPEEFNHVVD